MAELAVAFFSTIGTAAATAAPAAATAAATAATSLIPTIGGISAGAAGLATAGSSALTVLQGLATAGSLLSTVVGGVGAFAQAQSDAQMAKLQGTQDYITSQETAMRIRREMVQKTGDARVAFAGSGLDISSADAVTGSIADQANFETEIERTNAQRKLAEARMKARQYRTNALFDLAGTAAKAGGQFAQYKLSVANRG